MQRKEEEHRSRAQSLCATEESGPGQGGSASKEANMLEQDFSKQMLYVFDPEEIRFR